jgi:hypothetical protein
MSNPTVLPQSPAATSDVVRQQYSPFGYMRYVTGRLRHPETGDYITASGLEPHHRLAAMALVVLSDNNTGETYVSAATLAAACAVGVRAMRRTLGELVTLGVVSPEVERAGQTTIRRLLMPIEAAITTPDIPIEAATPTPVAHDTPPCRPRQGTPVAHDTRSTLRATYLDTSSYEKADAEQRPAVQEEVEIAPNHTATATATDDELQALRHRAAEVWQRRDAKMWKLIMDEQHQPATIAGVGALKRDTNAALRAGWTPEGLAELTKLHGLGGRDTAAGTLAARIRNAIALGVEADPYPARIAAEQRADEAQVAAQETADSERAAQETRNLELAHWFAEWDAMDEAEQKQAIAVLSPGTLYGGQTGPLARRTAALAADEAGGWVHRQAAHSA